MSLPSEEIIKAVWPSLKVEKNIGSGASGEVFKVCREGIGRQYHSAVKVIQIPKSDTELVELRTDGLDEVSIRQYCRQLVQQMSDEIDLMESLKSAPNIVSIEDFHIMEKKDRFGWIALIRMELLENLNSYIERKGIKTEDVVRLGIDICTALEYCERRGIVHRDIKPANVFITEFGDYKLGDFGISRQSWLSSLRSTKGTYAYMAPEVARGEAYDKTVDLYSLGIMMYKLLNDNRLPFMPPPPAPLRYEDNRAAISRRFSGDQIEPPSHGVQELVAVILKACSFKSEDRFPNALEMKKALLQCRGCSEAGQPVISAGFSTASSTSPLPPDPERSDTGKDPEAFFEAASFLPAGDLSPSRLANSFSPGRPKGGDTLPKDDIPHGFMPAGGLL